MKQSGRKDSKAREIQPEITTVDEVLAQADVLELLQVVRGKAKDIKCLTIVTLDREGMVEAHYAGEIGDIGACGLMDNGKYLIMSGI